jgi:hypothetical protein
MESREPIELQDSEALRERIKGGGVITVTRGPFADAIAHMPDCRALRHVPIPGRNRRYWWTPDYQTAATTLGARKCQHCQRTRKYPSPFLPRP